MLSCVTLNSKFHVKYIFEYFPAHYYVAGTSVFLSGYSWLDNLQYINHDFRKYNSKNSKPIIWYKCDTVFLVLILLVCGRKHMNYVLHKWKSIFF